MALPPLAALALLAPALAGCSSAEVVVPDVPEEDDDPGVTLRLSVAVASRGNVSRADIGNEGYEPAATELEQVKTLRVLITGQSGILDHNRMVTMTTKPDGKLEPVNDNLNFKVGSNEHIRIWLLANEATLPMPEGVTVPGNPAATVSDWLNALYRGTDIDEALLAWTVTPYSDVTDDGIATVSAFDGKYNPMSEMFEILTLPKLADLGDGELPGGSEQLVTRKQDVSVFITRAVSKVTYRFDFSQFQGSGLSVTDVRLNGLSRDEYVFPNDAVYAPAKYKADGTVNEIKNADGKVIPDRYITSFASPQPGAVVNLQPAMTPVEMVRAADKVIRGPYYFAESLSDLAENAYTVLVCLKNPDDENDAGTWLEAKPLVDNILAVDGKEAIARNTHLYIDIRFRDINDITYTAIEAPYNSVLLEPTFGL